jgi:hypothetical protein
MNPKNEMSVSACRMAFPKAKWVGKTASKTGKAVIPENSLQSFANEAIAWRKWIYVRFHNKLLWWIKTNEHVPEWVKALFFGQVAGKMPDNLIMVQVGPGCFLSFKLELKTQDSQGRAVGKLHGKQKTYALEEKWFIARSPEQITEVLDKIQHLSERVKKCLTETI